MSLENLKYPIGKFKKPNTITREIILKWITEIEEFPSKLNNEVVHLNDEQLDTSYRTDGWTIRQVIHHCADSHINSFIRLKMTLTEDTPTIKPYLEDKWAELLDSKILPIENSLSILYGLHKRWASLLKSLSENELEKRFIHPEQDDQINLTDNIGFYAWHCKHHLAHITELKKRKNWN